MSQPAFSMRIKGLEDRLGVTIVHRGNRFQGFTPDGERIVTHARQIVDDMRALEQEVRQGRGEVAGALMLGVVPTAAAPAAHVVTRLNAAHPGITVRIETTNALAIQQGVIDGKFDAGLSYCDGVSEDLLVIEPMLHETYVLLAPRRMVDPETTSIDWSDAARLPLSLLAPDMQNRRILDGIFSEVGSPPNIIAETSGYSAALVMVVEGLAATVVPSDLVETLGPFRDTAVLDLETPHVAKSIGLITPRRAQGLSLLEALRVAAMSPAER